MKTSFICILLSLIVSSKTVKALKLPFKNTDFTVSVTVKGLQSSKGKVVLYLYNSETGYPADHNKAYKTVTNTIVNNTCMLQLVHIPVGTYAIAYFHDENGNGKLDTNLLGIPNEGVGASNNAKGYFGPPAYKDAMFVVKNDISMILKIRY